MFTLTPTATLTPILAPTLLASTLSAARDVCQIDNQPDCSTPTFAAPLLEELPTGYP